MKELLEVIARALVNSPDDVRVTEHTEEDGTLVLELSVAPEDMGKVIGRKGRIAKAIRTVVRTAALKNDQKIFIDIVD